ncbi:MAG: hypothetical protein J7M40_19555 [Planctomycetes bacterium]|nr:hypothetical protein [Planctomycetota bacterium]
MQRNDPPGYPTLWTESAHCDDCESCSESCVGGCDTFTADYAMDFEILVEHPWTDADGQQYEMENALLSIPTISIVTDQDNFFDPTQPFTVMSPLCTSR